MQWAPGMFVGAGLLVLGAVGTAAAENSPILVEIVTAHAEPVVRRFETTGEVVARDEVALSFPAGGRVTEIAVEEGDSVEEGKVLAQIDSIQQEQALRSAEAELATATADLRQAEEDLSRAEALLTQGASTRVTRDTANTKALSARAVLAQANSDLDSARRALEDTTIRAPVDGVVIARTAEVGTVVSGAQTVIELAKDTGYDAVFDIPEALLARADKSTPMPPVELRLVNGANDVFFGEVDRVSPQVDPAKGSVEVRVRIGSPPDGLAFGTPIRGGITGFDSPMVSLPAQALTALGDGAAVWVVDEQSMTVALRPVQVMRHVTGSVIVAKGLQDGEQVVGRGAHLMFPDRRVAKAEGE